MLNIIFYNVGLGQSIFVLPDENKEYSMLIDAGASDDFNPLNDFYKYLLRGNDGKYILGNFTLTNYDNDYFQDLPFIINNIKIKTVNLSRNIDINDLENYKPQMTNALELLINLKRRYNNSVGESWNPPYKKYVFSLTKQDLNNLYGEPNWNNLSQVIFLEYGNIKICISGDLEKKGWELLINKNNRVKLHLESTQIFVAPHHGRENAQSDLIFEYCSPKVIIISDKGIIHGTQENSSNWYNNKVIGNGVNFDGVTRKVLTTRNDGHLLLKTDGNNFSFYKYNIN